VNRRDAQGMEKTFGDPMQGTAEWTVGYGAGVMSKTWAWKGSRRMKRPIS
jgi:hypothetical protein